MKKLRLAFMGTPDFSVATLEMLHALPFVEIVKVISMPDRPVGRGLELKSPPVIVFAKENKLAFHQTENVNKDETLLKELQNLQCDLIIVLAFAQFLGSNILNLPKLGCFNIHTSLLPRYRGAAPIQHALLNGDQSTGVSIQRMVKKMDAGDLVHMRPVKISLFENSQTLFTKLKFESAIAVENFLYDILNDKCVYTPQDESQATFAPTISKDDGKIHFKEMNMVDILNRLKAFEPWPSIFCFLNGQRLKILQIESSNQKLAPGVLSTHHGMLEIGCQDSTIRLSVVQLEGKKKCSDRELLNGLKNKTQEFIIS